MKSKTFLIVVLLKCFLLFSIIESAVGQKPIPENNIYFRIYHGVEDIFLKKHKEAYKTSLCLPTNWIDKNPEKEELDSIINTLVTLQASLSKLNTYLSGKISSSCKNKDKVVKYIIEHQGENRGNKDKAKSFLQLRMNEGRAKLKTKQQGIIPFDSFYLNLDDITSTLDGLFDMELPKQFFSIMTCLGEKYEQKVKDIKDIAGEFVKRAKMLSKKGKVSTRLIVDMICNWKLLGEAIKYLNVGFKMGNILTRYQSFGYFLGYLIKDIANVTDN